MSAADPEPRRYRLDAEARRFPGIVLGGSPVSLFRITTAADELVDRIEGGEPVHRSRLIDALLDGGAIHPLIDADDDHRFGRDDVTIVVPTLGPPEHTPTGDRVIVVDDGSQPPVAAATIRLDENAGPAAARNAGLAQVATPLVAFVDADVSTDVGWLDDLLPHFDDDRVAVVAPRVRAAGRRGPIAAYEAANGPLDLGAAPGRIRAGNRVGYVPAAALLCRTDALRSVGGFDRELRFGEDVDLVWRLDEAGWRCRYEPKVVVEHEPRATWRTWLTQRISYGSSAAPLASRHPGALAPMRTNGWSIAAWTLPLLGRSTAARAAAVGAGLLVMAGSSMALIPKLPGVPARESVGFAVRGHLAAGDQFGQAVRRVYWPLLAVAAIRSRPAGRALTLAAVAARSPVRIADDVAYSIGVWRGVVRHRELGPLTPKVSAWPPRTRRRQRRWRDPRVTGVAAR